MKNERGSKCRYRIFQRTQYHARTEFVLHCTVSFASITMLGLTCQLMNCAQIYVANMFFVIRDIKSQLREWKNETITLEKLLTKKN